MSGFTLRIEIGLDATSLAALAEVIKRLCAVRVTAKEELLACVRAQMDREQASAAPIALHVFPQTDAALAAENLPPVEAVSAPAPFPPGARKLLLVTRKWPECWKEILRREYPEGMSVHEMRRLMEAATPERAAPSANQIWTMACMLDLKRDRKAARPKYKSRQYKPASPHGAVAEAAERVETDAKTIAAWALAHGGFGSSKPTSLALVNRRRRELLLPQFRLARGVTGSAWTPTNERVA